MARVVILGAGISGHTAAMTLKHKLGKNHEVIVITPNTNYQWVPSNVWVGVGRMTPEQVKFPLKPIYDKFQIQYIQGKALSIHPEGGKDSDSPYVSVERIDTPKDTEIVSYDYLINATGPKLNFEATPGLGPDKFTQSVCTYDHAQHSWLALQESIKKMEAGEKQTLVIGVGHPTATCQGAAFEYTLNVAYEIRKRKLENMAELIWLSNEYELGDFGMGGAFIKRGGFITPTKVFAESILRENNIKWIKRAGVKKVTKNQIMYETLDGKEEKQKYDFAMLIPGFAGAGIKAFDSQDKDITEQLFNPAGFMKVDADYTAKVYEDWSVEDWPTTYQNPDYDNIFAIGIAFAPPHPISKPMKSANGTPIFPAPPRTGMPSGVMGKITAQNVAELIKKGRKELRHRASMGRMGAACIISSGMNFWNGSASAMTVFPIVPDWNKYPEWGRDITYTVGEPGLASHWIKLLLHHTFIYKAKGKFLWWLIPE